jgi:hypothetical protein
MRLSAPAHQRRQGVEYLSEFGNRGRTLVCRCLTQELFVRFTVLHWITRSATLSASTSHRMPFQPFSFSALLSPDGRLYGMLCDMLGL